MILQQDWSRFAGVMAPKVQGSWNLHRLTADAPLDFFVLFSSAAAVLGSPGQGNHAAANAFLDGLAHHRRGLGLPALTVNLGAITEDQCRLGLGGEDPVRPALVPGPLERARDVCDRLATRGGAETHQTTANTNTASAAGARPSAIHTRRAVRSKSTLITFWFWARNHSANAMADSAARMPVFSAAP